MNRLKTLLLILVCSAMAVGFASCRKTASESPSVRLEPKLIMFGGWKADNKGVYLARSGTVNEGEKTYFALNQPNDLPVVAGDAPKMEIDFGKDLYMSGGNNIGKYAQVTTEKDETGKITKAQAYVAYTKSTMGTTKYYDLEPAEHSLHGWSSDNVNVVMSREGKKVFVIDAHSGGMAEVKLKNITAFGNVALATDKNGFYVAGEAGPAGFGIEYIDFNNVKFKAEQSRTVLSLPRPTTGHASFRGILSPDEKVLAVLTNTNPNADIDLFNPDAENKLMLYDIASGQMTREYKLPNGDADLRNMLFVKGPWWRGDNQAFAFDLRPTPDKKTFYSIDLQSGQITSWFTSEKQPQAAE